MGRTNPICWIEVRIADFWISACRFDTLRNLDYDKAFLLGHGKGGPIRFWDAVKPIKGLPDDLSDTLESFIKGHYEEKEGEYTEGVDITYYTLEELKSIDLDKELGKPNKDFSGLVKASNFSARITDEEQENESKLDIGEINRHINNRDKNKIMGALHGEAGIRIYKDGKDIYLADEIDRMTDSDLERKHDIQERIGLNEEKGKLLMEPRTRKSFAQGLGDLIEKIERIREKDFKGYGLNDEDMRIIIWSEYVEDKGNPLEQLKSLKN